MRPARPDGRYPLDPRSRTVAERGRLPCPDVELVRYRGGSLRYRPTARVHPAFRERLRELEAMGRAVGQQVYGRAPVGIRHLGTYACRRIRGYPHLMSEHAFGNAIDVAGFDFGRAAGPLPDGVPARLRRPFQVRVEAHWGPHGSGRAAELHSRFLRSLARRVLSRPDLFRIVLGPAWPGHHDHFHFDVAPYRVTAVFEER